jgi:hypothetical protein
MGQKHIRANLRHAGNMPARSTHEGVALVSGFSPALMQGVLGGEDITPYGVMLRTVMAPRYNI